MKEKWYNLSPEEALERLQSRHSGLTDEEAQTRLYDYGPNELEGKRKPPLILIFLRQFRSPLVYILLAAAIIKLVTAELLDATVIIGALLLMAGIGFFQETKAEQTMEALKQMSAPKAKVRRGGQVSLVPARVLVPGDIVILESGDRVPADGRLIEISSLKAGEAPLTGESMSVDKHTEIISGEVPLADRKNLIHMGTVVTSGRAVAVVTATGMATEIGKIATAIQEVKPEPTPLQRSLGTLGRHIIVLVLGTCGILAVAGVVRGLAVSDVFLLVVAAAVSAIPEELPAVVNAALAAGMRLMAKRNAIIRRLVAVETLGSASVICSDKTGTLTLNQMTVRQLYAGGNSVTVTGEGYQTDGEFFTQSEKIAPKDYPPLGLLLKISTLCNDALLSGKTCCDVIGDPTEGALLVAAAKAGIIKENLEVIMPRLDEIPFQSERRYMATLHPQNGGEVVYVKGAPERLLELSRHVLQDEKVISLDEKAKTTIAQASTAMARDAMRVMAAAYLERPGHTGKINEEDIKGNLVFVGLLGMTDPPRQDAKEAIRLCHGAGIKVVMITGDNQVTAESVSRDLGLSSGKTITGSELEQISDEALVKQVGDTSVFARIEPLHKLRIVSAFKKRRQVVAMTGDGVNDAPALKSADIGIAMGITGTDVAKEASDMVLTDDNFASIVAAVEEGRAIFNRLRNVVFFVLSTGLGELLALTLSVVSLGIAPLLPLQIIWINLVTGTIMSVPLALEPRAGDELTMPPRHPRVGLLFPGLVVRTTIMAVLLGVSVFLVFERVMPNASLDEARTTAFCAVVVFEWLVALSARSDEKTVFQLGVLSNRWLVISISAAVALQIMVVYTPLLQPIFKTAPIGVDCWAIAVLPGVIAFGAETIRKRVAPRLFSSGKWQPTKGFRFPFGRSS